MKKLVVLTLMIGAVATSCGTKEPQMAAGSTDSTAMDSSINAAQPMVADTMQTTSPDAMKTDSAGTMTPETTSPGTTMPNTTTPMNTPTTK